jgi:hypothetical protein
MQRGAKGAPSDTKDRTKNVQVTTKYEKKIIVKAKARKKSLPPKTTGGD